MHKMKAEKTPIVASVCILLSIICNKPVCGYHQSVLQRKYKVAIFVYVHCEKTCCIRYKGSSLHSRKRNKDVYKYILGTVDKV